MPLARYGLTGINVSYEGLLNIPTAFVNGVKHVCLHAGLNGFT